MKKILLVLAALFLVTACSSTGGAIKGSLTDGAVVSNIELTEKEGKVVSAKEVTTIEMAQADFDADYTDMYKQFSAFKSADGESSFAYEYKDGKAVFTVTVDFTVIPAVDPARHLYSKLTETGISTILTSADVDFSTEAIKTLLTEAKFEIK